MTAPMPLTEDALRSSLDACRVAQKDWSSRPLGDKLRILRKARHRLAHISVQLIDAISSNLARTRADSYVAEVLPLLASGKFLENNALKILRTRRLGARGRPVWLAGISTTVQRVPFGVVLVIGPSNYPLLLPGVQTLQALAAGNAVIWKPGLGGQAVARIFAAVLVESGISSDLLHVTDEPVEAGITAIKAMPDKIFFTGSSGAGREVLKLASELTIPVVAELSGCDAVVVLPSADVDRVLDALIFGMRLNGSATCMAPRRLFLVGGGHGALLTGLRKRMAEVSGISLAPSIWQRLTELLQEAEHEGALLSGEMSAHSFRPILVENGTPSMRIAQADIFAPVLTVLRAQDADEMVALDELCPFGLTAAIFGDEKAARSLGDRLNVGTVIINDLIVPTADTRVSFGGRRGSGFGSTRGAEGLLEMTAPKTIAVRGLTTSRHYEATTERHEPLFAGVIAMSHGATLRDRFRGLRTLVGAAQKISSSVTLSKENK